MGKDGEHCLRDTGGKVLSLITPVSWGRFYVLLEVCQDRAYCEVLAESSTFSQDPCPDTFKYLEVHYKCRPNEFERRTVCEGDQMELACKKSKRLAIYSALFGRVPNDTGPCPPNRPGYINCQSAETVSEIRTACQGRKRCEIQASEAVFGNPCATGINKYLSVTFACVPKKILKQLRRHRGRLSPSRNKKKRKKKEKKDKNKKKGRGGGGEEEVTGVTTDWTQREGTTSGRVTTIREGGGRGGGGGRQSEEKRKDEEEEKKDEEEEKKEEEKESPPLVTTHGVLEGVDRSSTADTSVEKASADSAAANRDPGAVYPPHHIASTPTPPPLLVPIANKEPPTNIAGAESFDDSADPNTPRFDPDRASSVPKTDHFNPNEDQVVSNRDPVRPNPDKDQLDPNVNRHHPVSSNKEKGGSKQDRDRLLTPGRAQDNSDSNRNYPGSDWAWNHPNPARDKTTKGVSEPAKPKVDKAKPRDNSVTRSGVKGKGGEMSTEASHGGGGSVGVGVTEAGITALCVNHTLGTMGVPTVRTLPNSNEAPVGVVRELFSVVRFVQGHQEKAILYLILGVCVGLILLLSAVLGRVCYKLKHNTHAKLDLMEPTHSRNVSHLVHHTNHHSLLETPMLEHSDSIDRIEVVRFEPRGTTRSGYHSSLHNDSGDRSLNNYYG
ncbi:hypothetical protein ACOMHN_023562 [Nucella lapillus]